MGKFDDKIEEYMQEINKHGFKGISRELLIAATRACGPSIYLLDASTLACSAANEIERVKENFCAKNLGVTGAQADQAIQEVCEQYKSKSKKRAIFYALLTKNLKKESKLI